VTITKSDNFRASGIYFRAYLSWKNDITEGYTIKYDVRVKPRRLHLYESGVEIGGRSMWLYLKPRFSRV